MMPPTLTIQPEQNETDVPVATERGQSTPASSTAARSGALAAARTGGVVLGGSALLNLLLAGGAVATALGPLARPGGHGPARAFRRLAGAGAAAAWAYVLGVRPWHLRWGAVDAELDRALPGDALVPHAVWRSTRAVTIDAPAAAVWPWLVQFGQGRAGFYSYDWLENLAGLDVHSADRIVPELQTLAVGDFIPAGPGGAEAGSGWTVVEIEAGRALILRVGAPSQAFRPATDVPFAATWVFVVEPVNESTSRLVVRWRGTSHPTAIVAAAMVMTELPHFVMERKMLLGIKQRAEGVCQAGGA